MARDVEIQAPRQADGSDGKESVVPGLFARPKTSRVGRVLAGAAGALVFLGACSASVTTTKQLDTDRAENNISTFLKDNVEAPVDNVSCPEREVKQGDVFECTAQVATETLRLRVTQDDDEGNVTVKLAQAVLDVEKAVTMIERQVAEATDVPVEVNCGAQRFLVKDPGSTFDCSMASTSRTVGSRVTVTVRDVEGNVDLRLS